AEEEQRKITLAIGQRDGLRFLSHEGHNCMDAVIERAKLEPEVITSELVEALESLQSAASDYGSTWWFEFAKRNCAVDAHGNLVLLDCIYDRQQVEREHAAAAKARRTA
ncbi:MAG TPA: hypothetical protein VK571_00995, partial [Gemmatimonadaceae bacterium]|nr:hypothetical protein [Gemmatimonadaceae bacterium]